MPLMKTSIIAAVAENGVIGKDQDLAWHLPADMQFFKETTAGRTVIMGRKNYESIPHRFRPLPKRTNIVITRDPSYEAPGCHVVHSLHAAVRLAKSLGEHHAFIIGGGEIYRLAIEEEKADDLYITEVHAAVNGDTYFPKIDEEKWKKQEIGRHEKDEKHAYPFTIYHYRK